MALCNWNDSYSVKIDSIDEQHKVLLGMINEFNEKIKDDSGNKPIIDLVKKMKEYTIQHFTYEEKLFKQHAYPGSNLHEVKHKKFIDKVADLEKKIDSGELLISSEITNFLKEWLRNHIMGDDQQYSSFLISKGVK